MYNVASFFIIKSFTHKFKFIKTDVLHWKYIDFIYLTYITQKCMFVKLFC